MRETKFIEQNKEKWLKFEQLLRLNKRDPDKLSDLFIQITDDLSYARTNYPNRSIKLYLNNVAQQLFYNIYKNKRENKNKFVRFWKEELPSIVYESRKQLLLSLFIFLLAMAIGVVSSINDPDFSRTILGDSYVDMTLQNIEGGDPMAVYKKMNEVDMFLGITINNIMVAFRTFIMGIFMSLGAIIILMYNGIMVGTFQYFFVEKGLFWESFLTIWMHGTLEISSIIIAGGAGIVLGKGFVFPGTHSRLRAFQLSARRGLKILIGVVPIFIFASLIESFITRYTETPDVIRALLILISLLFIVFYFIWLPLAKKRNGTLMKLSDGELLPKKEFDLSPEGKIKHVNEVFREAILTISRSFGQHMKVGLLTILGYIVSVYYILKLPIEANIINVNSWVFAKIGHLINYNEYPLMFVANMIFLSILFKIGLTSTTKLLKRDISTNNMTVLFASLASAAIINIPWFLNGFISFLLWAIIVPPVLISMFIIVWDRVNYMSALQNFGKLASGNYVRILGLYALLLFISFIFLLLLDSPFLFFYLDFVQWNFAMEADTLYYVSLGLNYFIVLFGMLINTAFFTNSFMLLYFPLKEINEANSLKASIAEL